MKLKCFLFGHEWCYWTKQTKLAPTNKLARILQVIENQHRSCNHCNSVQHWQGSWTYGNWAHGEKPDVAELVRIPKTKFL